ncbi:hypothetical protein [Brachyspira innocens]|uniref:hypothetical protein n=1 Tax=Brachyspira innocens TaxID=13264 RepID=UPI0026EFA79A|nr:hypothetical protein [Brachyspira innocens]
MKTDVYRNDINNIFEMHLMLKKNLSSFMKSFSNIKYTVLASIIEIKFIIGRIAYL